MGFYIHSWLAPVATTVKWVTGSRGLWLLIKLQCGGAASAPPGASRRNQQGFLFSRPGAWSLQPGLRPGNRPQPARALQPVRDHRHVRTCQPGLRQVSSGLLNHPLVSLSLQLLGSPGVKPSAQCLLVTATILEPFFVCLFFSVFIKRVFAKKKGTFVPAGLHLSCSAGLMLCSY